MLSTVCKYSIAVSLSPALVPPPPAATPRPLLRQLPLFGPAVPPGAGPVPASSGPDLDPTDPAAAAQAALPLHPAVWRASQLSASPQRCTSSGFAVLDAQLPGGGWPHGALTELLLPRPGIGELRLLAPVLAGLHPVMLFDPPAVLSAWALQQQGLDARHWLVVGGPQAGAGVLLAPAHRRRPRTANGLLPLLPNADVLWALEQALRSGQLGAVLAWLPPGLPADVLRRLQLAAQAHDGPVFLLRDPPERQRPSAAPLRLLLQPAGVDGLQVRLLKRRGPTLDQPLRLALPSPLSPGVQARAQAQQALQGVQRSAQQATQQAVRQRACRQPSPGAAGDGQGAAGFKPSTLEF